MNILGIGNDLCGIERMAALIQRFGPRILNLTFTQAEQGLARHQPHPPSFYAGRFAAKEAFVKAVGSGLAEHMSWTDIEVIASPEGLPATKVSGGALARLRRLTGGDSDATIYVSISHDARFATALVILAMRDPGLVEQANSRI